MTQSARHVMWDYCTNMLARCTVWKLKGNGESDLNRAQRWNYSVFGTIGFPLLPHSKAPTEVVVTLLFNGPGKEETWLRWAAWPETVISLVSCVKHKVSIENFYLFAYGKQVMFSFKTLITSFMDVAYLLLLTWPPRRPKNAMGC